MKFLFFSLVAIFLQLGLAQETGRLSIFHSKDGNFIKRGEIVGLPSSPRYVPSENEVVQFRNPKEVFYQIKVKDESNGNIHLSSVKLCQLLASEWNDEFILHLDEQQAFYHLDYYSTSLDCEEKVKFPLSTQPFTTRIQVRQPTKSEKPFLGNFESQAKKQNSQKPKVEIHDQSPEMKEIEEKSFFQKHWAYLLFGVLILLTMGGDNGAARG
ncbi:hypothetical protein BY458DRAFT_519984 [Sporodiniella umbellata]|nr:hypothetical protein BY458DRAFT_519984 [Sporodiniella umbellata]